MLWKRFRTLTLAVAAAAAGSAGARQTAPAAAPAQLAIPSAEDFGALPFLTDPILSPSGLKIAANGLVHGKQVVLVADETSGTRRLRTVGLPDQFSLEWVRWAGDDRLLVSLSRAETVLEEPVRVTRLMLYELSTGRQMLVGPRAQGIEGDDLVHVDKAGKFVLLNTQPSVYDWPEVYRVDLDTGKFKLVVSAQEGVWEWYADPEGVVRAGLGSSGSHWWITYRSNENEPFKRVIKRNTATNDDDDTDDIQQFVPIFGSDSGYAVAQGKTGHLALFRYDFKADALGELVYENPEVDIDDFTLARDGTVRNVYYTDDRAEIAWFDPEMKKLQAAIDRALPGTINRIVSVNDNKTRMLIWSGSADDPGIYYVYDRSTNHMDQLVEPYDALHGKQLAKVNPVRFKARDGLEIRGYLTLPPGKETATGLPLVVMPHGGPFARDEWAYDPWVQFLASRGYAVIQPNFRGSTGFGFDFVDKGTGQWGRGMQDDIDDSAKWLIGRGVVDPKRVCIMGASFGGYAAMWAAVRNPELYRCAISFAGISDVASMLRYDRKSFSAPRYFRDWRARVQGDKSFELDQISPIKSVDRMTVPILIAHGEVDDNVPPYQSKRLHEALLKLGREHEYVTYPREGHGFTEPEHSIDFLHRVEAFLKKYNPS